MTTDKAPSETTRRGPQTILEVLRYEGMSEQDIKTIIPGAQVDPPDPRPFKIYRNRRGWPRWYQRFVEAWWVIRRTHSLHTAWQAGHDHGTAMEYRRTVINGGR